MSPRRRSTQRSFAISFAGLVIALAACSHGSGDSANPPSRDKRMSAAEYRYGRSPHPDRRVTYQPDVVMPGGGAESIRSVSANGMTYTIDGHAAHVHDLKPGKIMFVSSRGVGRVLGVRDVGSDVAVTIGPITVTDLIRKADIHFKGPLDLSQVIASVDPHVVDVPAPLGPGKNGAAIPPTSTTLAPPEPVQGAMGLPGLHGVPTPPMTLPASAPSIPSVPIKDFQTYPLNGTDGFGYEVRYDKGGTKVFGYVTVYLDSPRIVADLVVTPRGIQTATISLIGAAGIRFSFAAGSAKGINGNIHYMLPLPVSFHIPIYALGIPFDVSFNQVLSIDSAFSAKDATIRFEGDYAFGGPITVGYSHGKFGVTAPLSFHVRKSLLPSIQGPSVGINSFVMAYGIRALVGLGAGGFAFGPYVMLNNSIALINGSDLAIVKCKGATYLMNLGYGIGYQMPIPVVKVINFFLHALNLREISASGGTPPKYETVIRLPGYYPKVPACQGAA